MEVVFVREVLGKYDFDHAVGGRELHHSQRPDVSEAG
jgi:hypothetical protein